MTALEVPAAGSPEPGEPGVVAELWQRIDRLHADVERLVAEREAAWDRVEELTTRSARMAAQVPLTMSADRDGDPDGGVGAGTRGGLAQALTRQAGPRLAVAVAAAVGDLPGLSRTTPALDADTVDAVVDGGCVADLPDAVLVDLASAGQRLAAWSLVASTLAAGELAARWERYPPEDAERSPGTAGSRDLGFRAAVAETATACLLTEHTVAARIDALRALPTRLPRVWGQVTTGVVDLDRARLIHEKTLSLTTDSLAVLEPQLVVKVTTLTMPQLRVWLERAVAAADPEGYSRQAREAHDHRGVSFRAAGHGMGRMAVTGSLADIETARIVVTALAALAQDDPGHERLPDAKRADTVLDLIAAALDPHAAPDDTPDTDVTDTTDVTADTDTASPGAGVTPACLNRAAIERYTSARVHVTVPLSVIVGADGLGEVGNDGPLPAEQVRELLAALQRMGASATWRCLITDDDPTSPTHGTVLGIGRAPLALVRTATGLLRELVQARARCCSFPGCRRQASGCEVDHRIPHREGGATCECNLHPLCAHHHRLRERGFVPRIVIPRPRQGSTAVRGRASPVITRWTTPTGRTITTETEHPPF